MSDAIKFAERRFDLLQAPATANVGDGKIRLISAVVYRPAGKNDLVI